MALPFLVTFHLECLKAIQQACIMSFAGSQTWDTRCHALSHFEACTERICGIK